MSPAEAAARVINAEIEALSQLRAEYAGKHRPGLASALLMIRAAERVVVSGIGKSGLIGRKIAATFQSTGQLASFVHPAESLHGDMGAIGPRDLALLLSNSGETDELRPMLDFANRRAAGSIVITSRPAGCLARAAHHVLPIPRMPEGCPIGRAPMASAIQMLALGDMLAAALMAERGFTAEQFGELHHGGYLSAANTPWLADLPPRGALAAEPDQRATQAGASPVEGLSAIRA